MNDLLARLKAQSQEALDSQSQSKVLLESEDAAVKAALDKANAFYQQGQINEAIAAWNDLPFVAQSQSFRNALQDLRRDYDNFLLLRRSADDAELKYASVQERWAAQFENNVNNLTSKLQVQIQDLQGRTSQTTTTMTSQDTTMQAVFEKTDALLKDGKINEALAVWDESLVFVD